MRIWDTFIFGTEADLDMLECRLTELAPVVHKFVISEAAIDHQGHPKTMWLASEWDRFAPWHDQIFYIDATDELAKVDPPPEKITYWAFEDAQREIISRALEAADPDDLILHGDVDEIPRPSMLKAGTVTGCRHHVYHLEWLGPDWWGTVTMRAADAPKSLRGMRNLMGKLPVLEDAGWHLSWFGTREQQAAKFSTTVHADIPQVVAEDVASGRYQREGWHWMQDMSVVSSARLVRDGGLPRWEAQRLATKLRRYRGDDFPQWVRDGQEPAHWHKPD